MSDFRTIPLTRGLEAVVDAADYEALSAFRWTALSTKSGCYAARRVRADGKDSTVLMHRQLLDALKGLQVDHINHDRLDNRRSNLRLCTQQENLCNTRLRASNTSGFMGVTWNRAAGRWQVAVSHEGRSNYIGVFADKLDAARAYDKAAKRYHGGFASLNFGDGQ